MPERKKYGLRIKDKGERGKVRNEGFTIYV
jgi:hypothetical protein